MKKGKIAILTGGGDCPGINAVIRAVAKKAMLQYDMEVIGVADGYEGIISGRYHKLSYDDVSGIINLGGTILGTSNKANPFRVPVQKDGKQVFEDRSAAWSALEGMALSAYRTALQSRVFPLSAYRKPSITISGEPM